MLDNSGLTTDGSEVELISKDGTIPTIISINTSNVTDTKDFILFNKNDSLKSNEKGCSNFCHIMQFFGGISNYQCVLYSKGQGQWLRHNHYKNQYNSKKRKLSINKVRYQVIEIIFKSLVTYRYSKKRFYKTIFINIIYYENHQKHVDNNVSKN